VLGDRGLDVVVDRARLHHGKQVVGIDLEHPVHRRQVQDHAAADRVGAAGQPGSRTPRHHGGAQVGAGAHDVLHLRFGARPHGGRGLAGRGPLGLVVRQGGEHIRVGDDAIAGQPPAERLDQNR